jgi:hypothetical protein
MKIYLRTIGLSLIPTMLIYLGKSDTFFKLLKDHSFIDSGTDVSTPQLYCFIIGVFWAGLITPVQLSKTKTKLEEKKRQFEELLSFNKELYFTSIKENLKKHNKKFSTRLFVPCKGFNAWFQKIWNKKIIFSLIERNGITDPINTKSLYFEVSPNTQGLVGKTCKEKAIVIDCNVDPEKYNLTHYQKSKTNGVKFCTTAPIFNKNNQVIAVLAVDSNDEINFDEPEVEKWKDQIIYYCAFVDKHLNL